MKKCTKCGDPKEIKAFSKDKSRPDGLCTWCKRCRASHLKLYHQSKPDLIKKGLKKYRIENSGKIREQKKAWAEKNSKKVFLQKKAWRDANLDKLRERHKQWCKDNPDRVRFLYRDWYAKNPEKAKTLSRRKYIKHRSLSSGRLNDGIRRAIQKSLHGYKNGYHWEELVGYTLGKLKTHLEKQFQFGMTWENYGPVWHVDHKIPIVAFNFEKQDDIDFRRCWALNNLQPLWAGENMSKGAKIDKPFQPSLVGLACGVQNEK